MPSKRVPTYGTAERRLKRLGFTREKTEGDHRYYRHPCGAIILLPGYSDDTPLSRLHQGVINGTLRDYELIPDADQTAAG